MDKMTYTKTVSSEYSLKMNLIETSNGSWKIQQQDAADGEKWLDFVHFTVRIGDSIGGIHNVELECDILPF